MVVGILYMLISFLIGMASYRSVFRKNASQARVLGIFFYCLSGLALFGAISGLIEWISRQPICKLHWDKDYFLGICIASSLCIFFSYSGRHHRRWAKTIEAWRTDRLLAAEKEAIANTEQDVREVTPPFQFSLRELLGLVTVVALIASITTWMIRSEPPRFIEHATPREAGLILPQGASDVCCARGFRGTITYEFTIDENRFFEWAKSGLGSLESEAAGIPIKPIVTPFQFSRYTNWKPDNSLPAEDKVTITHGYYYLWQKEDRSVVFAYDKDHQRAYFHFNSH